MKTEERCWCIATGNGRGRRSQLDAAVFMAIHAMIRVDHPLSWPEFLFTHGLEPLQLPVAEAGAPPVGEIERVTDLAA